MRSKYKFVSFPHKLTTYTHHSHKLTFTLITEITKLNSFTVAQDTFRLALACHLYNISTNLKITGIAAADTSCI
uniref:Uncharacterized protein n=1 Tax=Anguilla anguilla TaxID=7936 RepID=A0A0E9X6L5_ANGAN